MSGSASAAEAGRRREVPLISFAVEVWIGALMLISIIVLPVPGVFFTAADENAVVIESLAPLYKKAFCRAEVACRPAIASGILSNPGAITRRHCRSNRGLERYHR